MLQRVLGAVLVLALTAVTLDAATPHALLAAGVLAVAAAVLLATLHSVPRPAPHRSPHAVTRDERRCRGSFRRQSHPSAPGRPLPRAPQIA